MQYLVQLRAAMQQANKIDAGEGPGPTFAKIIDRFRPEAVYGTPDHRSLIMVVNLGYSSTDGRTDVCSDMVYRLGADVYTDHEAGSLWRGDRQRQAHPLAANDVIPRTRSPLGETGDLYER